MELFDSYSRLYKHGVLERCFCRSIAIYESEFYRAKKYYRVIRRDKLTSVRLRVVETEDDCRVIVNVKVSNDVSLYLPVYTFCNAQLAARSSPSHSKVVHVFFLYRVFACVAGAHRSLNEHTRLRQFILAGILIRARAHITCACS